uniref:Uncharacterized protein n=1 Tax=Globisporangium ultimum (strain ATCC 200006 / CBS 805.95 / DAOM BR144) TaxID=431595 RepID=K3WK91_GLOUD
MEGLSVSLAGLTKEIVAVFGCLCIVFNILLPIATDVLRFVALEGPEEWAKWETHRTQQRDLKRLERKLELLRKRDAKVSYYTRWIVSSKGNP